MPPMMSGRSGSRRWRSNPCPTRNGSAGGFGAAATAGWCSAWTAVATTGDGLCRRRRDGRAEGGQDAAGPARVRGAVEMEEEPRKREGAVAMAPLLVMTWCLGDRDSAVAELFWGALGVSSARRIREKC